MRAKQIDIDVGKGPPSLYILAGKQKVPHVRFLWTERLRVHSSGNDPLNNKKKGKILIDGVV